MAKSAWVVAVLAVSLACVHVSAQPPTDSGQRAVSVPSKHLQRLSFSLMGKVREVYVKAGDTVRTGQPLMVLDSREEDAELAALKKEAETDLPIREATAIRDSKKVALERVTIMHQKGSASDQELEEARLELAISELRIEKAKHDQELARIKADKQALRIEQMRIVAPVDGIIERIELDAGEVVDPNKPAITMVKNDPLWVEAHLKISAAQSLKLGQELRVRYDGQKKGDGEPAKVIYRAPKADPGSDTQLIRMELPNPAGRDSGQRVLVDLD